jgi:DNA-binding transcriptional LysR family regulator
MPSYTLRQLEYLLAVAEYGSVTGAAGALHVSQSSLSSGISELERAMDLQLLVRHHAKGVSLTEAGERLLVKARTLIEDAQVLEQVAHDLGSVPVGSISIGMFSVIAPYFVPELIAQLADSNPDIEARIEEVDLDQLNDGVLSGKYEVGFGYDFGHSSQVTLEHLVDIPAHVVVPADHKLAKSKTISLSQLRSEKLVLLDLPHSRDYFAKALRTVGVEIAIAYRSTSAELVRAMVARGMGVALLNLRPALTQSLEGKSFVILEISDDIPPARLVALTSNPEKLTRRAVAVLEAARKIQIVGMPK